MTAPCTPFFNRSGGFGITGSPSTGWTFTKTAEASTAETPIVVFGTSDGSGSLIVENASATDAIFSPRLRGVGQTTGVALNLTAQGVTDTGTNGVMQMVSRISTSTVIATRPMFEWLNHSTSILSLLPLNSGANSALSWGTQTTGVPTFTTRSVGTRLVLLNDLGASSVDYALGVGDSGTTTWFSIATTSTSRNFKWYAGTTNIMKLDGSGALTITGTTSNSLPIFKITDGTVSAAHYIGTGNNYQVGTSSSHTFQLLTNNALRVTINATAAEVGIGKTATAGITLDLNGPLGLKSYTVATMPAAGTAAGQMIYVSDAAVAACVAFSNGTNWKRCDNAATTVV